jgi:hypothetical protein
MKLLAAILLILGIILMASAFFYPMMFDGKSDWSEQQADDLAITGQSAHDVGHGHVQTGNRTEEDASAEDVMEKFQRLQAELDAARARPLRIAGMLKWLGVALTVLGAGLYYAGSSS